MADFLKPVSPGQDPSTVLRQSRTINAWMAAGRMAQRQKDSGALELAADKLTPLLAIPVRNDTGSDLDPFKVVTLDEFQLTDAEQPGVMLNARESPLFAGVEPVEDRQLAIFIEPVEQDKVARAAVMGVVPAWVTITNADHRFADLVEGDTEALESSATGPAVILWKSSEALDEPIWCLVLLSTKGGADGMLWFRITAIPSEDPGPYSGVQGNLDEAGDWTDTADGLSVDTLYRAPSNDSPPRIPVDQIVLAVEDPESPGNYRMTPWGGYFRYKRKILIRVECDGGNLVNIYKWEYFAAREFCISPAPPD